MGKIDLKPVQDLITYFRLEGKLLRDSENLAMASGKSSYAEVYRNAAKANEQRADALESLILAYQAADGERHWKPIDGYTGGSVIVTNEWLGRQDIAYLGKDKKWHIQTHEILPYEPTHFIKKPKNLPWRMSVDEMCQAAMISSQDQGQNITLLREHFAKQIAEGVRIRRWDWHPSASDMTPDERAKYILETDASIKREMAEGKAEPLDFGDLRWRE